MALTTDPLSHAPHDHVVQFYAHDDELVDSVGPYLREAIGTPVALPRLQGAPLELARTFPWSGRGPAEARRFVTETLTAWGHTQLVDDAAVIASELATNAVIHARTEFTLAISRRPDGTIRVAVRDASLVPPQPRHPAPLDGSGRGLWLIEAIAADWGADSLPDGKEVWAQIA